jgi:hypothetical protein
MSSVVDPIRQSTVFAPPHIATPARLYTPKQLDALPPVVARYLRWALTPGQPLVRHATIRSAGDFLLAPGRWSRFAATQQFTVSPPSFVWDATIYMMGVLPIRVRDSYAKGNGSMRGHLLGIVPVVNQRNTPEMAVATLQRFLAEAVWFPTALLPRTELLWRPIDNTTARAIIMDHGRSVWVDFHFDRTGAITSITAKRYRDCHGTMLLTPWTVHVWAYAKVDGMMVPTHARAQWETSAGPLPYWRGTMSEFIYDFAER